VAFVARSNIRLTKKPEPKLTTKMTTEKIGLVFSMGLGVSGEGSNPSFCANTPETYLFPGRFSALFYLSRGNFGEALIEKETKDF
jgi:hypothetical protein